jgi:hypothetical protein
VQLIVQLRSAGFDMGGYHGWTLEKSTGAKSILLDNEGRRGGRAVEDGGLENVRKKSSRELSIAYAGTSRGNSARFGRGRYEIGQRFGQLILILAGVTHVEENSLHFAISTPSG